MNIPLVHNAQNLNADLKWLTQLVRYRMAETRIRGSKAKRNTEYNELPSANGLAAIFPPPVLEIQHSSYGRFLDENQVEFAARVLLVLSLANHVTPELLTLLFWQNNFEKKDYPEFGGVAGINFDHYVPTGLTYLFIMGGYNIADRLMAQAIFTDEHLFARERILTIEPHYKGEPSLSGKLALSEKWLEYFVLGQTATEIPSMKYPYGSKEQGNSQSNNPQKQ
jgi:hypothetical protein